MKLIIFIHTCKLYEQTRSKLLENTWANDRDIVFITDNEYCELNNYIYIGPYETKFTYHPNNVKKMFNLFLDRYNDYDYFMIVDDDSYVYIDKLKQYLSFFNKEEPYMIGDFLNWTTIHPYIKCTSSGDYNNWAGGGPGIVFTKSCITEYITLYSSHTIPYANHDVWLHDLYKLSNRIIKRTHCPGFHQYNSDILYKTHSLKNNNLISLHLNRDMNLLLKYHDCE
jgi:hypothetical protein